LLLGSLAVVLGLYAAFVVWLFVLGRRDDARALATFMADCIVLSSRPELAFFSQSARIVTFAAEWPERQWSWRCWASSGAGFDSAGAWV
jgi:hypothetical protein